MEAVGTSVYDLPDEVMHHILSFLSMEDIARLSCTSKKWKELCISIPFLSFDNRRYRNKKNRELMGYINNLLNHRGKMETTRFSLTWRRRGGEDERFFLGHWMIQAMQCKVSSLHLDISCTFGGSNLLRFDIMQSWSSLKFIEANLRSPLSQITLPSSGDGFCNLLSLDLSNLQLPDKFGDWISSSLKFLKRLCLKDFYGINKLDINRPTLENFNIVIKLNTFRGLYITGEKLERLDIRWLYGGIQSRTLNISAPNLVHFFWKGYSAIFECPRNFRCLEDVSLDFTVYPSLINRQADSIFSTYNLLQILNSIEKTAVLKLNGKFIDVLCRQGCLPFTFSHVKKVILVKQLLLDEERVPAIASLLEGLPNMKAIHLSFASKCVSDAEKVHGFSVGFWESKNFGFSNQVTNLMVKMNGTKNEVGLMQYLIKHAGKLKKLVYSRHEF